MDPTPRFQIGDSVLLGSSKEMGRVESLRLDGGEYWYTIKFAQRRELIVEDDLEPLGNTEETLESLTAKGQWGKIQAFRSALVVERILNTNHSTVYAFRAQRILFEAFQYKPLLNILESADRRLLIADEVGLGKTVEAGLILAELEARQTLDRVLVVCPSRLREKWRDEMSRKFGREFDIATRADLDEYLEKIRRNSRQTRLRSIVSMQTLRNEESREQFFAEIGLIDLVIVDEAHHARNPSAKTSEMLRELCEIAGSVVLLTATPLHLGNRDLFTLVQGLRPSEFRDYQVFDDRLNHFKGIHEAALLVRSRSNENVQKAIRILEDAFVNGVLPGLQDQLALQVIADLKQPAADDRRFWVEVERRIQDLHPLATVLTRTRKRDVHPNTAVRSAKVFRCQWTDEEDDAYRKLVHGAKKLGWIDQRMSLGQIQRARQAASCLPAALKSAWAAAKSDDDAVELTDIMPTDLPNDTKADRTQPPPPAKFTGKDSKFEKLLELMAVVREAEPDAKILIFTFFVGTSHYLREQLIAHGYRTLRIAGDVPSNPKNRDKDERGNLLIQFRDDPAIKVLVSTEVGSEGLDFQFCHYLVNYDLPWNPMVVEQRIGRIDRFGQKSDKLHILNLVVEGTVEDRILYRLYDRLGLFEQSIGQLEAILGEEVSELQRDYVGGKLTPEEAERRVEQAALAIENRRAAVEVLEKNAGILFGHEEYLKDQLERVNRLGRYISEKAMLAVIDGYLQARHPGVRYWEEPAGIYRLHLTEGLRKEIQDASKPAATTPDDVWIDRSPKGVFAFCFDGERAYSYPEIELINVSHPFLKSAVEAVEQQLKNVYAKAARVTLHLDPGVDEGLGEGVHFLMVFTQFVEGIRARRMLETVAWSHSDQKLLSSEVSERLLHLVQEDGDEWTEKDAEPKLSSDVFGRMVSEALARNRVLFGSTKRENEALFVRRKSLIEAEFKHDRGVKEARLNTAISRGRTRVIPALQGQIQKAEALYRSKLAELDQTRESRCRLSEPIAVCAVKIIRKRTAAKK